MANQNPELSEVASELEEKWEEDFVFELRVRGVSGHDIGAALSEVKSHVSESGLTAQEVFGDPVLYARALDIPPSADHSAPMTVRLVIPIAIQLAGCLAVLSATRATVMGDVQAQVSIAGMILFGGAMLPFVAVPSQVMRFVGNHRWWFSVIMGGICAAVIVGNFFLPRLELPQVIAWVLGLLLLVVGTVGEARTMARRADDPIEDPLNPTEKPSQGIGKTWIRWGPVWMIPAFVAVSVPLWFILAGV